MKDYGEVPNNLEMINLGSTFSKYGFDYQYFGKKGFNFAVAPQTLKTDRKVLEKYKNHIKENAIVVVVVVCPFGFCVYDYDELKQPLPQKCIRFIKKIIKKLIHYDKIKKKRKRNIHFTVNELAKLNSYNRVVGWQNEFSLKNTITQQPTQILRETFVKTRKELAGIISLCKKCGFRPIIINMPAIKEEYSKFSDNFIKVFYENNLAQSETEGVPILDYFRDERFNDISLYENYTDCFNDKGRRLFASIFIADMKRLDIWEE